MWKLVYVVRMLTTPPPHPLCRDGKRPVTKERIRLKFAARNFCCPAGQENKLLRQVHHKDILFLVHIEEHITSEKQAHTSVALLHALHFLLLLGKDHAVLEFSAVLAVRSTTTKMAPRGPPWMLPRDRPRRLGRPRRDRHQHENVEVM